MSASLSTLFDAFDRTDMDRASRLEPEYDWWNRSARTDVEEVRKTLEGWFAEYPASDQEDLCRRFRSEDDDLHASALFELFVHAELRRVGYQVECHPSLAHSAKKPDFLASRNDVPECYVEAVLAGPSVEERRVERLKDAAIEVIDSLQSSRFWAATSVEGRANSSLPLGKLKLRERILEWLASIEREDRIFPFDWEAGGLTLHLRATRKNPQSPEGRLLATESGGAFFVPDTNAALAGALRKKASRYGVPELPYLIAVNLLDKSGGSFEQVTNTFGQFWGSSTSPVNTRVSGGLIATVWNPMSAAHRTLRLVTNPAARHPLQNSPFDPLDGALAW